MGLRPGGDRHRRAGAGARPRRELGDVDRGRRGGRRAGRGRRHGGHRPGRDGAAVDRTGHRGGGRAGDPLGRAAHRRAAGPGRPGRERGRRLPRRPRHHRDRRRGRGDAAGVLPRPVGRRRAPHEVDPAVRQHHQGRDAAPHRRFEQLHRRPGPAILRSTYTYHAQSLGWGDIGYNVLVDKFGRLWEGRSGGLASTVVGAHAGGFNTSTFGVSMMGNYDVVGTPQPMIDSVAAIIGWKFSLYGVNPKGTTTLTSGGTDKYAAGARVTLPTIHGHRDTKSTACPGRYGYARLPEIRDKVAARMANTKSPIATRYDADAGLRAWLGAPVGGEQSAAGVTWQVYANGARLYSSPNGGVRLVLGGILERYLAAGGPAVLGPPITDDAQTPGGRGAFVRFQHGDVYWSPATGSQLVRG
ncbi:MAG TPA: N-acetylmuramoyl-L-alanine amidase, partial [Acidimicrobiales bacterium]